MSKHWRSAVIGTNVVGVTHLRAISTAPMCTLAAVCDLAPARARAALDKLGLQGIPVYESLPEMLRKEKLDVVHVCTPSGAHLEAVLACTARKIHVVCEKPLEITVSRVRQMVTAARETEESGWRPVGEPELSEL